VWDGVGDGVQASVQDGVRDGVWDGMDPWPEIIYGAHDVAWLAVYDWFAHHGLSKAVAPLSGIMQLARSAGWWWAHHGFAVVSDRPTTLHDERVAGTTHRRRLHNPTGPSVTYPDDWALWHWHGQLVPKWVIEAPTIDAIAGEPNTEIRRCGIESLGWGTYLRAIGARPVDTAPDPGNPGHNLELFDLPEQMQVYGQPVRLLVMRNASRDLDGSRRMFAETVPVAMPSAIAAAAWQFDVDPGIYAQLARAT
jgi:hypothetical protein